MQTTMDLFARALEIQPSAEAWCKDLGLSRSALAVAKHRGRLAPIVAGGIAMKLGESPAHWMAIAAIEAEPESPLLKTLKTRAESWQYSSMPKRRHSKKTTQKAPRRFFYACNEVRYALTAGASRRTDGALGLSMRQMMRQIDASETAKISASSGIVKALDL